MSSHQRPCLIVYIHYAVVPGFMLSIKLIIIPRGHSLMSGAEGHTTRLGVQSQLASSKLAGTILSVFGMFMLMTMPARSSVSWGTPERSPSADLWWQRALQFSAPRPHSHSLPALFIAVMREQSIHLLVHGHIHWPAISSMAAACEDSSGHPL